MQTWSVHIIRLLEEPEIGVLLGATALLLGVVSRSYHGFEVGAAVAVSWHIEAGIAGSSHSIC